MTKAELKEALDMYFDDDEVVVCADENGVWDNIEHLGALGRLRLFSLAAAHRSAMNDSHNGGDKPRRHER